MLPKTLALVDDDVEYADGLSRYLREKGVAVETFTDGNDLLAHADPYAFGFYVTDLTPPGVDGSELIELLRCQTNVGIVVVSGRFARGTFEHVITAGADMYLNKPVQFEQVTVAIRAVVRRSCAADPLQGTWRLYRRTRQLVAPDGSRVDLSVADCALVECFVEAEGQVVARSTLLARLGRAVDGEATAGLNAMVFRLRRRIEGATAAAGTLATKSGVGYTFRAPLRAI